MPLLNSVTRISTSVTDANGVPIDPTSASLTVTDPTGATTPYDTPQHPGVGQFFQDVTADLIGRWTYDWTLSGVEGISDSGSFLVVGDDGTLTGITDGPNALWCSVGKVMNRAKNPDVTNEIALECAIVASNLLWVKSGRQFTGLSRAVLRPCARPRGMTIGAWSSFFMSMTGYGWIGTWGIAADPDAATASLYPAEIDLGVYPLTKINEVKIDGITIPPDEYRIDNWRTLVRQRPSATATPTQRAGWPMWQDLMLPPTEPGTFSVDASWGMAPPFAGISAAELFAAELAKARVGATSLLPQRTLSIVRQGISISVRDPMEYLAAGMTGIYEVDMFIQTYNATKAKRRPRVWSPDLDHVRRTTG